MKQRKKTITTATFEAELLHYYFFFVVITKMHTLPGVERNDNNKKQMVCSISAAYYCEIQKFLPANNQTQITHRAPAGN
jgi:hypothetical protein